jgi:hypothetical protein
MIVFNNRITLDTSLFSYDVLLKFITWLCSKHRVFMASQRTKLISETYFGGTCNIMSMLFPSNISELFSVPLSIISKEYFNLFSALLLVIYEEYF